MVSSWGFGIEEYTPPVNLSVTFLHQGMKGVGFPRVFLTRARWIWALIFVRVSWSEPQGGEVLESTFCVLMCPATWRPVWQCGLSLGAGLSCQWPEVSVICLKVKCNRTWSVRPAGERASTQSCVGRGHYVSRATSRERLFDSGHQVWTPAFYGKVWKCRFVATNVNEFRLFEFHAE